MSTIRRTYLYRLNPTYAQARAPQHQLDVAREVYNGCLLKRREGRPEGGGHAQGHAAPPRQRADQDGHAQARGAAVLRYRGVRSGRGAPALAESGQCDADQEDWTGAWIGPSSANVAGCGERYSRSNRFL